MKWLEEIVGSLPIWRTSMSKGCKRDEPNKGEVFVVTHKRVWLFGWFTWVTDVRFENKALNERLEHEYAERNMKRALVEKIATLVAGAGGNCPCNCHDPAMCEVSEPFEHHDCVECWIALIGEICSLEKIWELYPLEEWKRQAKFQAEVIWVILVAVCGASPDERDDFIPHAIRGSEYRFQGKLGFGGKVYIENPPWVSCYSEDENPERLRMIASANGLLAAIARLWQEEREQIPSPLVQYLQETGPRFKKDVKKLSGEIGEWLAYGLDHFFELAIGATILIGGLWLAISTSTGG